MELENYKTLYLSVSVSDMNIECQCLNASWKRKKPAKQSARYKKLLTTKTGPIAKKYTLLALLTSEWQLAKNDQFGQE